MKYIDAEKLIAEIEKQKYEVFPTNDGKVRACSTPDQMQSGWLNALTWMLRLIDSLQQEQSEQQNGKFVFPKFLYARTTDNKTIDVSYAPQSMEAIEYVRNDFVEQEKPKTDGDDGKFVKILVRKEFAEQFQRLGEEIQAGQSSFIRAMNQQEQPEEDLGKEIQLYLEAEGCGYGGWIDGWTDNDLKKLARHFYELGLNARKEK